MKKNNCIKIFSFVLCLVILLGAFALTAGAKEEKYTPIEWELDQNLEYLIGNGKRYERYYAYGRFYGDADCVFYFSNGAIYDGTMREVYGDSAYPHIVSVRTGNGYSSIFVDAEGKKILDAFLDRTDCIYYLEDFTTGYSTTYCEIEREFVDYLDKGYKKSSGLKTVDVRELGEAEIFELTVHDKTVTKAFQHGAIYGMPNGSYYYVCFEDLDNSYFDADGYFSYRAGNVPVYEIKEKARLKEVEAAITAMKPKIHDAIYEEYVLKGYCDVYGNPIDNSDDNYSSNSPVAIASFIVMSVLAGIVAPTVLLVFGIVFAKSKKMAKCWYAVSACAALWIVSAALFLILTII